MEPTTSLSYKTCISCKRVQENTNFYNEKNKCKNCLNEYKRDKIKCKIFNIITTRNYYYKHMQKHPILTPIIGKICTKCNIDKPKDSFHNDKYKKDGKMTIYIECRKVSKDKENNFNFQNDKNTIDIKHEESKDSPTKRDKECTSCNKIISKTNRSKHKKTIKHSENVKTLSVIYI